MSHETSRRQFLQVAGGSILLTAALAACAPVNGSDPSSSASPGSTEKAKAGGTLEVAAFLGGAAETTDPLTVVYSSPIHHCMYDRLTSLTGAGGPEPSLAESWESSDLKTWTFKLREGVKFHNGDEMTAKDVVATFQRMLAADAPGSPKATWLSLLAADGVAQGADEYTVVFNLKRGAWDIPELVSHVYTSILPAGMTTEQIQTSPIGTGPYRFKSFTSGEKFQGLKNEDYWREGYPNPDAINITNVDTSAQRMNGLQSKQFHLALNLDPVTVQTVMKSKDITVHHVQSGGFTMINMLCKAPLDDVRVRQAMKLSVDREAVRKSLLRGFGVVGRDHTLAPSLDVFPELKATDQDLKKAKRLLADAGYPDGIDLDVHFRQGTSGATLAQLFQAQVKEAGIRINLVTEPAATMVQGILGQKFPAHTGQYGERPGVALTDVIFGHFGTTDKSYALWSNPDYDRLSVEARAEVDEEKRKELYKELAELLVEDGNLVVSCWEETFVASQGVVAFEPSVMDSPPLWNPGLAA
jgi:peptide/nickel transport system substrate-binding protein